MTNDDDPRTDALAVAAMNEALATAVRLVEQGGVPPGDAIEHVAGQYGLRPEVVGEHLDGYRFARRALADAGCDCAVTIRLVLEGHGVSAIHEPTCAALTTGSGVTDVG